MALAETTAEHFNSSVIEALFKLSITSRWALMAALGLVRLILERRRDLINDNRNRAAAADQEIRHFDNARNHTSGANHHSKAA